MRNPAAVFMVWRYLRSIGFEVSIREVWRFDPEQFDRLREFGEGIRLRMRGDQ